MTKYKGRKKTDLRNIQYCCNTGIVRQGLYNWEGRNSVVIKDVISFPSDDTDKSMKEENDRR